MRDGKLASQASPFLDFCVITALEHKFDFVGVHMPSGRQRKLDAVVARLQLSRIPRTGAGSGIAGQYGPAAIRKAALWPALVEGSRIAYLSTTFAELDAALARDRHLAGAGHVGGLPRGRITEISVRRRSGGGRRRAR